MKNKKRRNKNKIGGCWDNCKKCKLNETDYIHICLEDVFVTYEELLKITNNRD